MCSVIVGITSLGDLKETGKLGVRILTFYFFTTILAVILGIIFVNLIKPGEYRTITLKANVVVDNSSTALESIIAVFTLMFPSNFVVACKK